MDGQDLQPGFSDSRFAKSTLFNHENVPSETLFYSVLRASDSRIPNGDLRSKKAAVEEKGETVLICREGKPVAELKAAAPCAKVDRLKPNPDLKPIAINHDPTEPLSEDEWPSEYR